MLVSPGLVLKDVTEANAPMRADLRRSDLVRLEEPDQVRPRQVEKVGRLLGGQLCGTTVTEFPAASSRTSPESALATERGTSTS